MDPVNGHPIPQDVTGFQFRLIGDMTVKQFVYLAIAVLITFILFWSPLFFLLKVFFSGIVLLIAVILTFVPIDGRPADAMLLLFIKALIRPNQYMYKKIGNSANTTMTTPSHPIAPMQPTAAVPEPPVMPTNPKPPSQREHLIVEEQPEETSIQGEQQEETKLSQEEANLEEEIQEAKQEEQTSTSTETHAKVLELEKQLQQVLEEKQSLEDRLSALERKFESKPEKKSTLSPPTPSNMQQSTHVKSIPPKLKASVGAPLTPDVPNLITGIVKDPRGNVLPNILIEVKDKDSNPVRAFKTNGLGQFLSATPLINGTYTVTFEDPQQQHHFDTISLVADGNIIEPLEVTSIDAREELRKELFTA